MLRSRMFPAVDGPMLAQAATVFVVVTALLTQVVLFVRSGRAELRRVVTEDMAHHVDYDTFWRSADALRQGADIYVTGAALPNLNPPLLTVVLAPFGTLPPLPSYRLWTVVSLLLVVGSVIVVAREVRLPPGRTAGALATALLSAPLQATLGLGQIYGLLSAGLTATWWAGRRGRSTAAGVALGVTVALKPSLAPVLLVPLVHRSWSIAGAAAGGVAGSTVFAVLVAGPGAHSTWLRMMAEHPPRLWIDNASLPSTVARLTAPSPWTTPVLDVPHGHTAGIVVGLLLVAVTLVRCRTTSVDRALWAVVAASLLASPVSWYTYLVVLLPGVVAVLSTRPAPATALLALSLIGADWFQLWREQDGTVPAVATVLHCVVLAAHWFVLLRARADQSPGATSPLS